jgi:diguanylate cyclase (GGDEF)-like protein
MVTTIDELTGLLSYSAFNKQLEAAVGAGENLVLVLVVVDLDHMLYVNERYGHAAGDAWIRVASQMLSETFAGEGNILGRSGGDEFMALVRGSDIAAVFQRAEALRARVEKEKPSILVNDAEVRPGNTIALGLASYPPAVDMNDLVDRGREALRRAKLAGGNKVALYHDADTTDGLTGLLTRATILQELDAAVARAQQENSCVSVFLLDIDQFKQINDEFGHRAGDEVLRRLGHILETNFKYNPAGQAGPDSGIPGRLGGDEFIVLLPGLQADSAFIVADEVRRLIEDSELTFSLGSPGKPENKMTLRFHISGGIACLPGDASEAVDLLRKADEALYRSKKIGRNRISLPASGQMVTKTSYYTQTQLERLSKLAHRLDKTEAFLLREALDDMLSRYDG